MSDVPAPDMLEGEAQPQEPEPQAAPNDPQQMTFIEHLTELRQRLLRGIVFIVIATAVCWIYAGQIYDWLLTPLCRALPDNCVVYPREMLEAFLTYVKTGMLAGFFVSSPLWMYQAWAFIAPGLFPYERRYSMFFSVFGGMLFIAGAVFGFFFVFPNAYSFMAQFTDVPWLEYRLSMKSYARLTMTMTLTFGTVFMTPLIILFLSMLRVVTVTQLRKYRAYAIVIIFIAAAFLTPTTDPLTFLSMAIPMTLLYEIGVLLARIHGWLQERFARREGEVGPGDL